MNLTSLVDLADRLRDSRLVWALGTLVVGVALVRILAALVRRRFERVGQAHWGLIGHKATNYIGATLVLLIAARAAGIDPDTFKGLLATAGVFTVAIGFAAQTSLSNLIAGWFLLFDRPFMVGDTVEMDGQMGVVQEIALLSTLVRTFDNVLVRLPNEVVLKSTILNYTRYPARRIDMRVGVAYGTDLVRARAVMTQAVASQPSVLLEPAPYAIARAFHDSSVELEVRAWVAQADFLVGRSAVVDAVHNSLREAGIAIAFPQVVVWPGSARVGAPIDPTERA